MLWNLKQENDLQSDKISWINAIAAKFQFSYCLQLPLSSQFADILAVLFLTKKFFPLLFQLLPNKNKISSIFCHKTESYAQFTIKLTSWANGKRDITTEEILQQNSPITTLFVGPHNILFVYNDSDLKCKLGRAEPPHKSLWANRNPVKRPIAEPWRENDIKDCAISSSGSKSLHEFDGAVVVVGIVATVVSLIDSLDGVVR